MNETRAVDRAIKRLMDALVALDTAIELRLEDDRRRAMLGDWAFTRSLHWRWPEREAQGLTCGDVWRARASRIIRSLGLVPSVAHQGSYCFPRSSGCQIDS